MRLLLARHGQSLWNEVRKFQGRTDVGLSPLGRRQAERLGRVVGGRRLAAVYVSPMQRAFDTATIALEGRDVPIVAVDELRELSLGEWEGCTVDEISGRDGDPYAQWVRAPLDCPPPGAEALPDVCERVVRAIDRIAATHPNGDEVLVVAHGGVISTYVCHLLGCSFNTIWRLRVDNASLTTVDPPRIVTLNDTGHLLFLMGGPDMAPQTPQRSGRPGEAGTPLDTRGAIGVGNWPGEGVGGLRPPRDGPTA